MMWCVLPNYQARAIYYGADVSIWRTTRQPAVENNRKDPFDVQVPGAISTPQTPAILVDADYLDRP